MSLRLEPEAYEALKLAVFERDLWRCRHCGYRRIEAHHIIFRSEQGTDTSENLVTLCSSCHSGVHRGMLSVWTDDEALGADGELMFTAAPGWVPGC